VNLKSLFRKKTIADIQRDHAALTESGGSLHRTLGFKDLTAMGIAAIIGAGIFSTIGNASFHGGPAVITLFIFTPKWLPTPLLYLFNVLPISTVVIVLL
jgi:amino acid transporter